MIFWKTLSFFGSEEWYLLIMPALLWCVDARLGLRVGAMFLLSANLNGALKLFFHAPRPGWVYWNYAPINAPEFSFGFPSGHAQNAVAVWGVLAAKTKTRLAWGAALLLCALIGLSRLILQVHFRGDVFGGWIIGALLLGAFLKLEKPIGNWLKKLDFVQQMGMFGATSFMFAGLNMFLNYKLQTLQIPRFYDPKFDTNAICILNLSSALKTSGALFGFLVGACWMLKNGGYVDGGNKILRYVIGLIGVAIFWFGLGKILPRGEDLVSLGAAYMRYALVGFWISAGAPLIFRRLESRSSTHPNPLRNS